MPLSVPALQSELAAIGLSPRGLSRAQAAAYLGVSPNTFDTLVADGRMPAPKAIGVRRVWDRLALDAAFQALPDTRRGATGAPGNPNDRAAPGEEADNPWDDPAPAAA